MNSCPVCKSNRIELLSAKENFKYKNSNVLSTVEFYSCSECNEEFIPKELIIRNDKALKDAKKHFDGLLSATEIVAIRKKLGITQEQASVLFGGGPNAFSKYERNEVVQSASMDKLLRVASKHKDFLTYLKELSPTYTDGTTQIVHTQRNVYSIEKRREINASPAYSHKSSILDLDKGVLYA